MDVLGVSVLTNSDDVDYHHPVRTKYHATALLECSRCTLFWVVPPVLVLWWFAPVAVIAFGVMGAASKLDDLG